MRFGTALLYHHLVKKNTYLDKNQEKALECLPTVSDAAYASSYAQKQGKQKEI